MKKPTQKDEIYIKQRCQYSKKGLETFGKQRRGYVVGKSRNGEPRILWDGLKTVQVYAEDFIEMDPLIELFIDDDGVEKEKTIEKSEGREYAITPEIITNIEQALKSLERHGLKERAIVVLIKNYCGAKVGITEIKKVLKAIRNLKGAYLTTK